MGYSMMYVYIIEKLGQSREPMHGYKQKSLYFAARRNDWF